MSIQCSSYVPFMLYEYTEHLFFMLFTMCCCRQHLWPLKALHFDISSYAIYLTLVSLQSHQATWVIVAFNYLFLRTNTTITIIAATPWKTTNKLILQIRLMKTHKKYVHNLSVFAYLTTNLFNLEHLNPSKCHLISYQLL